MKKEINKVSFSKLPENASKQSFIKNIILNSSANLIKDDPSLVFLPAGSWITGNNFCTNTSDYDMTLLLKTKDKSPYEIENKVADVRNFLKEDIFRKLKKSKSSEDIEKTLQSINLFPTPVFKSMFKSYEQFNDNSKLGISLGEKDLDTGLWQQKGALLHHFKQEGALLYEGKSGNLSYQKISDDIEFFNSFIKDRQIILGLDDNLTTSEVLNIICEFTDKMEENVSDERSFNKYVRRAEKYLFEETIPDIFFITGDVEKRKDSKFKNQIKLEEEYMRQINTLANVFNSIDLSSAVSQEKFVEEQLYKFIAFKEVAQEVLSSSPIYNPNHFQKPLDLFAITMNNKNKTI